MKKTIIAGAVIFLAGVVILTIAFAMSGWKITNISTMPKYEEKSMEFESRNQDIVIRNRDMAVRIGPSDDDKIHVTLWENEKIYYDVEDSDTLSIQVRDERKWYEKFISIDFSTPTFTLLLPEDFSGKLDLENTNGYCDAEEISVGELSLESKNGHMKLKNVTAQSADIQTSNGSIEIVSSEIAGELKGATTNGRVILSKLSAETLSCSTSNGKISAVAVSADGDVEIRTSNGEISLENLDAGGDITLKTSNGGIKGDIAGSMSDYMITSHTSNGHNNLPENKTDGFHQLNAKTSNGEIKITFTESRRRKFPGENIA